MQEEALFAKYVGSQALQAALKYGASVQWEQ
jgi:hypothetical protein